MSARRAGLPALLEAIARARVCVVGDVLLDVFTRGHTDRVCPDAPALIVHEQDVTYRPSGAALTAQPLRALGAHVHVVTVLGNDETGCRVRHLIEQDGTTLSAVDADRPTPCKNRILASHLTATASGGQLLLRVDREDTTDVPAQVEADLIAAARKAIREADAVLLSDYAKGVCTPGLVRAVIEAARAAGIPVIVDPKHSDPGRYTGASVLTPNLTELAAMTGASTRSAGTTGEVRVLAEQLRAQTGAEWVVVTRDAAGVTAAGPGEAWVEIPAYPSEVVDVAGAGDVLAGVLTAALGVGPELAAEVVGRALVLASLAAGLSLRQEAHKRVTGPELVAAAKHHHVIDRFIDTEVQGS